MHTDDLGRHYRRQMDGLCDADRSAIAGDQLLAMAFDIDDVAVQQDPARLAERHGHSLGGWAGSASCRQIWTGRLLPDLGIFRRTARPGEAALGPIKPVVNLAGADRVLVLSVAAAGGGAVTLAESADHHQVMPEPRLRPEPVELRHGVQYPCVIACLKPLHPFGVGGGSLRCEDVINPRGFVLTEFSQRPERVAESSGSQQHDLAVAFSDGITQRPAQPEVVLSVGGLAYPDGDPPLVRQPLAKELPQV